jgi:hypothetical protein
MRSLPQQVTIHPPQQGKQANQMGVNKTLAATRNKAATENTREMARMSPGT